MSMEMSIGIASAEDLAAEMIEIWERVGRGESVSPRYGIHFETLETMQRQGEEIERFRAEMEQATKTPDGSEGPSGAGGAEAQTV